MDIMGMMKKAQAMQEKLQEAQDELGRLEVEGAAGGGMVAVTMTAKGELKAVRIDPSLMTPSDKEILEDLIIAAFSDAKAKADRAATEKMQALDRRTAAAARHEAAVLTMAVSVAGPEIERLMQLLARLPGLGRARRSRAALHLIRKRETLLGPLAEAMRAAAERIVDCSVCGNVDSRDPCTICADERRDPATIVVVESVADLWALERARAIRARYHVLGGVAVAARRRRARGSQPRGAVGPRRRRRGQRSDPRRQRDRRRPDHRALHQRHSRRASGHGDAPRARRPGRRRTRLSRRRHACGGDAAENSVLRR